MSKKLDAQNWLARDPTLNGFVLPHTNGVDVPISSQGWVTAMLTPQLQASVPHEVQRLFDGARGAIVYGYYYYALCMMGALALFRVAEAALAYKRQQLEASPVPRRPSFDDDLQWLADRGIVHRVDWRGIEAARTSVAVLPSAAIYPLLEQVTKQINALFPAQNP